MEKRSIALAVFCLSLGLSGGFVSGNWHGQVIAQQAQPAYREASAAAPAYEDLVVDKIPEPRMPMVEKVAFKPGKAKRR